MKGKRQKAKGERRDNENEIRLAMPAGASP